MSDEPKVLNFNQKESDVNFKEFAQAVAKNDMTFATRALRDLLGLSFEQAEISTEHFKNLLQTDEGLFMKTMELRAFLANNQHNDTLTRLQELFALNGTDLMQAFNKIKDKF